MKDINLFPDFDLSIYRSLYSDLRAMSDEDLLRHWHRYGKAEGRRTYQLADRKSFAGLIEPAMRAMEIGPFDQPLIHGENVSYCDILDQEQLRRRASRLRNRKPENIPFINYILGTEGLDAIKEDFDAIISSHVIEHQPDLIQHLLQVQRRLEAKSGRYFLIIPDKRYCFDRFLPESTCAEIIDAHESARKVHSLQNVIEHSAFVTHNDHNRHWNTPISQDKRPVIDYNKVQSAIKVWKKSRDQYIDVHAWKFTPESFIENIQIINSLGYINFECERTYHTLRGNNEFWVILKLNNSFSPKINNNS